MNIVIVRVSIALRQFVLQHKDLTGMPELLKAEVYSRFREYDTQLHAIYDAIENMLQEKP